MLSAHSGLLVMDTRMGRQVRREVHDGDQREEKQQMGGKRPNRHIEYLTILYSSLARASTKWRQQDAPPGVRDIQTVARDG